MLAELDGGAPGAPKGAQLVFRARHLEGFENVSLASDQRSYGVLDVRSTDSEVSFVLGEPVLRPGRYTLQIDRYVGVITDDKGVFYRSVQKHFH